MERRVQDCNLCRIGEFCEDFSGQAFLEEFSFYDALHVLLCADRQSSLPFCGFTIVGKYLFPEVGRTLYYVPYIISLTAISLVWQFILGPVFAGLYKLTGVSFFHLSWLGRPKLTFIIILLMTIWQNIGFYMVNYIAGIITIPRELMEAAVIDGANSRQCFMKVMLPLMVPSLSICILLSMMFGLKLFDIIMVFTQGGPVNSTVSVAYNIYKEAFSANRYGLATAKSFIFVVLVLCITVTLFRIRKKWEVEM